MYTGNSSHIWICCCLLLLQQISVWRLSLNGSTGTRLFHAFGDGATLPCFVVPISFCCILCFVLIRHVRVICKQRRWPTNPDYVTRNGATQTLDWIIFFSNPNRTPDECACMCVWVCVKRKFLKNSPKIRKSSAEITAFTFHFVLRPVVAPAAKKGPPASRPLNYT